MTTGAKIRLYKGIRSDLQKRLLAGVLLFMPFGIALLVIFWIFRWVKGLLQPIVSGILTLLIQHPFATAIPQVYVNTLVWVITVIMLLFLLYLLGTIGQFVIGKRVIALGETLMLRIPLVRTIYTATKQVIKTLSLPNREALKSVVLIDFPRPGLKAIGFLTGYIKVPTGEEFCKIFIPTTPNPTTGFFEIVPAEEIIETDLSIEEGFKMIISGGIVSPEVLQSRKTDTAKQK